MALNNPETNSSIISEMTSFVVTLLSTKPHPLLGGANDEEPVCTAVRLQSAFGWWTLGLSIDTLLSISIGLVLGSVLK
jgi:hypothetical protein